MDSIIFKHAVVAQMCIIPVKCWSISQCCLRKHHYCVYVCLWGVCNNDWKSWMDGGHLRVSIWESHCLGK